MNKIVSVFSLAMAATASFAQFTYIGDSDNGTATTGSSATQTGFLTGVGYDAQNQANKFPQSMTVATAQTLWQGLDFSASPTGQFLNAGDKLRIGIYAGAFDRDVPGNNPGGTLTLYLSLFELSSQGANVLPKGAPVPGLQNLAVTVNTISDVVNLQVARYYTQTITLPSGLNLDDGRYLLGFSSNTVAGGNDAQNFLYAAGSPLATTPRNIAIPTEQYRFDSNNAFQGGAINNVDSFKVPGTNPRTLAVRFEAQPVPEPASVAALGVGIVALLRRRRKA